MKPKSTRLLAARVLSQVIGEGRSLRVALPPALARTEERDRGLLQELCFGTLRWYPQLQHLLSRLLAKPLPPGEREVQALLLVGLYQLIHLRLPAYAAVSEVVDASRQLGKSWASSLINAVLRNFQRRQAVLLADLEHDEASRNAHPAWLLERLQADWPQDWPSLVAANNARPPITLRVNLRRVSRQDYLRRLANAGLTGECTPFSDAGIAVGHACGVDQLPGFREGLVSVQDLAGQLAAPLLDLRPQQRVLDACAAPGGKTCHILEREPHLAALLALDIDTERLARLRENLDRLGLQAQVITGNALTPEDWWDGQPFDRILLDAPCSATGVIRRHPDIKLLRQPEDIPSLAEQQGRLLERLWPLLASEGTLLYATCSVLKQENEQIIAGFLSRHNDAWHSPIAAAWGRAGHYGRQLLAGESDMDGFYYARLIKRG